MKRWAVLIIFVLLLTTSVAYGNSDPSCGAHLTCGYLMAIDSQIDMICSGYLSVEMTAVNVARITCYGSEYGYLPVINKGD